MRCDIDLTMQGWGRLRWVVTTISLLGVMGSVAWLEASDRGLRVRRFWVGPTPVTVFERPGSEGAGPVVVISHGFASSQQMMKPFAVTLARAGYRAVTFDYLGHGRNREPLRGDVTVVEGATQFLLRQTRRVVDAVLALPGSSDDLAILGHSMASDIVVRYAQSDPRVDATIAVSMFSPAVTAETPPNLLILDGALEGPLRREALRVLGETVPAPEPFRTYGDPARGTGRRAAFVAGREHLGVLYAPQSQREVRAWLDQVYDRSSDGPVDDRGGALLGLFAGLGLLAWPLASLLPRVRPPVPDSTPRLPWRRLIPAGLAPALATPLLLMGFPADFLSVLVGGYLAVHFAVYGILTLAVVRVAVPPAFGALSGQATDPARGALATALATAYAVGVVGLAMDRYFTSFALTSSRALLVVLMGVGTVTYFVADARLTWRGPPGAQAYTRACFLLSLGVAVALSFEELMFLLIIAVLIVPYFAAYGLFSRWVRRTTGHPTVGAVATALAFAWTLAVVFPQLAP